MEDFTGRPDKGAHADTGFCFRGQLIVPEKTISETEADETSLKKSTVTTVLVMGCTLMARVLGFVRNVVIAALFGASGQADVLNAVFNIPNNFRKLLAEGALSSAFIPVLSTLLIKDTGSTKPRTLVRNILTFLLLILIPLLIMAVVFARPVIGVFLDFPEAQKMDLASSLFRWICHYLLFISLSAVLMGVLNSHNIFVIPALTPVLFSVCVITSLLLFYRQLGIFAMAVGVLGGGLFQVLFQLPSFGRSGYDLIPHFDFRNEEFRRVLRLWFPVVATSSVFAINQQIAFRFASGLEEGSASALSYSLVIWQLPFGVFSASITTVLFPRLSRQAASGDREGLIDSVSYGLRFLFLLLLPSAVFFVVMGVDIVGTIYQRGEFTLANTMLTARVLTGYSLGLFSVGSFTFLQRFFYASRDYRTPFLIALLITALDVSLSLWLKETYLRVMGLAIANSIAFTVGFCLMVYFAYRRLGELDGRRVITSATRILFALVPSSAVLVGYFLTTRCVVTPFSSWMNLVVLLGGFTLYLVLTSFLYYVLGVEIVRSVFRRRLKRKLRR
jgi:putative peptidoglycan lipid II flippase